MNKLIPTALAAMTLTVAAACSTTETGGSATKTTGAPKTTQATTHSGNKDNPPPADVGKVGVDWSCTIDTGFATARGTLTNHSSKPSLYTIEVTFLDANGTQYANGTAFVNNVAPGGKAEWDANSLTDVRDGTTCKIVNVDRYSSQ